MKPPLTPSIYHGRRSLGIANNAMGSASGAYTFQTFPESIELRSFIALNVFIVPEQARACLRWNAFDNCPLLRGSYNECFISLIKFAIMMINLHVYAGLHY